MTEKGEKAYIAGAKAFYQHKSGADNPFDHASQMDEYCSWEQGRTDTAEWAKDQVWLRMKGDKDD